MSADRIASAISVEKSFDVLIELPILTICIKLLCFANLRYFAYFGMLKKTLIIKVLDYNFELDKPKLNCNQIAYKITAHVSGLSNPGFILQLKEFFGIILIENIFFYNKNEAFAIKYKKGQPKIFYGQAISIESRCNSVINLRSIVPIDNILIKLQIKERYYAMNDNKTKECNFSN
ncbi:hypothetical protein A3Q56_06821 [Intoshia linei]|uniref:Uncharacterized protein n=1 Tax=Intoshia linei TaxID=1819745 RepID=A0A177ATZ0_9BILA|nr:hypothetical protein A3Q56_06821 [Intoshia linei]